MNQYRIFKHPSGATEAVKQGWSWPAFSFGFIWALSKRMWSLGFGVMLTLFLIGNIIGAIQTEEESDISFKLIGLIASILFGIYGNPWRERNLASRGFEAKQTVSAASPKAAVALYTRGEAPPL